MVWSTSLVSPKDSFRGQVLQAPRHVSVVPIVAIDTSGKVWPLESLLDPTSYKDIIPYSYLPVYLYLCIALALISLTIVLRGDTGVIFDCGELLPAPPVPLPISILWSPYLLLSLLQRRLFPKPLGGEGHCPSAPAASWNSLPWACGNRQGKSYFKENEVAAVTDRWVPWGGEWAGYIYVMKSSFRSRNELLMAMEKLSTRDSSLVCADKR